MRMANEASGMKIKMGTGMGMRAGIKIGGRVKKNGRTEKRKNADRRMPTPTHFCPAKPAQDFQNDAGSDA